MFKSLNSYKLINDYCLVQFPSKSSVPLASVLLVNVILPTLILPDIRKTWNIFTFVSGISLLIIQVKFPFTIVFDFVSITNVSLLPF